MHIEQREQPLTAEALPVLRADDLGRSGRIETASGRYMAGISVSLDGANIQLSFQKDDQATAVVMDARAARA